MSRLALWREVFDDCFWPFVQTLLSPVLPVMGDVLGGRLLNGDSFSPAGSSLGTRPVVRITAFTLYLIVNIILLVSMYEL